MTDTYHDSIAALQDLAREVQTLREQLATAREDTLREVGEHTKRLGEVCDSMWHYHRMGWQDDLATNLFALRDVQYSLNALLTP